MVDSIFISCTHWARWHFELADLPLMNLAAAFEFAGGRGRRDVDLDARAAKLRDYETAQRVLGNVLILNLIARR